MDKRKVITAYRRGFISMQECAQLLGIDSLQIMGLALDPGSEDNRMLRKQPMNS